MTVIERAARALLDTPAAELEVGHIEQGEHWRMCVPQVRAVLQAIRTPSDQMLARAVAMTPDRIAEATRVYQAMIDAALSE